MDARPVTEVAVAVLTDPETGYVLIGSRPAGKPYAGWWELPGGKLEPGESVHEALVRELKEELNLTVTDSVPWFVMEKSYEHAYVRLHFRRSSCFSGRPEAMENQEFCWVNPEKTAALDVKLLPMVALVMKRLTLPAVLAVAESESALGDAADFVRNTAKSAVWVKKECEAQKARDLGAATFLWTDPVVTGSLEADFVCETTQLFGVSESKEAVLGHRNRLPVYVPGDAVSLDAARRLGAHGIYRRFF